ncbi:hypothetical protein [Methanolobus sp.]|uniref:hypothetical protein n=1 Tax=Methanolobus sp. TaxID=1874737 RepID=UPI0025F4C382|nr:hypothetical protein [Methanolobus sp.]
MSTINDKCGRLHQLFGELERISYPFDTNRIPNNGIYILFEKGESGHNADRIVRVGTHSGDDRLRIRLRQHFIKENKDDSILRGHIGRALLNKDNDPFLEQWYIKVKTKKDKAKHSGRIDLATRASTEKKVSQYIRDNFSFVVFEVTDKDKRMELESKLISTLSLCTECKPSLNWLGNHSPKEKIKMSGLWNEQKLNKESLSEKDFEELRRILMNFK